MTGSVARCGDAPAIYSAAMGSGAERYIVPYVVGLAPALLVALTWSPSGDWTPLKWMLRDYSAPIIGSELFVIAVALREGLLKSLPRWNWSRPVVAAAIILAAVAPATAFLAPLTHVSAVLTAYWFIHALFGLSIAYLCGRRFAAKDLVRAYMVGFAILAAQLVVFLQQIPDWSEFGWRGNFPAVNDVRHFGYYLAPMAGLGIGVMAVSRRSWIWTWAFATAAVAVAIALWTGSRGAVLGVAGGLVIAMLFTPSARSLRGWGGGLIAILVAAAAVSQLPAAPHPMMGLTRTVEATASDNVTTGRTRMWEGVLAAIKERPLFGHGEGQMREVATFSTMVQPHNFPLQVALSWGIVGLLCVLALAVAFARRAIPAVRRESGVLLPPFIAMAAVATMSLYDGSLYYALPISIFAACAGVIASGWRSRIEAPPTFAPARAAT